MYDWLKSFERSILAGSASIFSGRPQYIMQQLLRITPFKDEVKAFFNVRSKDE